jgi:antitoxin (DNA-binding transcriptional repressor) of toxin-antitoxin stability system
MRFLSVRELRGKSAQVWRDLPADKEMVITNNGHPVAILSAIDENSLEQTLVAWRQVRACQAVARIQMDSAKHGTDSLTMDAIDAEIQCVRKSRNSGSA